MSCKDNSNDCFLSQRMFPAKIAFWIISVIDRLDFGLAISVIISNPRGGWLISKWLPRASLLCRLYCKQSHMETLVGPRWRKMKRGCSSLGCAWQVGQKTWVWWGTNRTSQVTLGRSYLHHQYPLCYTKCRKIEMKWTSPDNAYWRVPSTCSQENPPLHFGSHMYHFRLGRKLHVIPAPTIYPRNWGFSVQSPSSFLPADHTEFPTRDPWSISSSWTLIMQGVLIALVHSIDQAPTHDQVPISTMKSSLFAHCS